MATQAPSLASVAAFDRRGITLRRGDELEPPLLSAVSDDYFATLGVRATLGRVVGPGIDRGLPRPADGPLHLGLPVPVVPEPLGHSLNEALLLQPDGGAVASFGPAGITTPRQQETLARGVYARFLNEGRALGDAVRESKAEAMTADPSTRAAVDGWNLLGDPAQRLPASP